MPQPNTYYLANNNRMRAKSLGLTEHFTESELIEILKACDYKCLACGAHYDDAQLTIDHVVALANGGTNTKDNLQILCKRCNSKKHTKTIDYRSGSPVVFSAKPVSKKKSKTISFTLRLPTSLYKYIGDKAALSGSSFNSEVIKTLAEIYNIQSEQNRRIAELERRLASITTTQESQP